VSAEKIRALNDDFRANLFDGTRGRVMVTTEVERLEPLDRARLLELVRTFDAFTADNDPLEEHDFGRIDFLGHSWCFKIDAFDLSMHFASPDPTAR
jgi:hypothetical protein